MIEYITVPFISLLILFILTKMLGYRQVSQLNMYDYINGITIGSIAGELVMSGYENMLRPLIAMIVYTIVTIALSKFAVNSFKLRQIIDGKPAILYDKGKLYQNELKKAKMDIDEFLMLGRIAGYFDLSQLETIILETNGNLSFYPKEKNRPVTVNDIRKKLNSESLPVLLIKEGHILESGLKAINQNCQWIEAQLKIRSLNIDDITLMYQESNGNLFIC